MSTRTTIFQQLITNDFPLTTETTSDQKKMRVFAQIVPAEDAVLTSAEVAYEDLPDGCIKGTSFGDGKFDGSIPVGTPETETHTLQLDYRKMPTNFRTWMTTESNVSATINGERRWLAAVWIIRCDKGNATIAVEDFPMIGIYVQYHQDAAIYTFNEEDGSVTMDVTLQHIGKAMLETVLIDHVRVRLVDDLMILSGITSHERLFDIAYDNGQAGAAKAVYAWCQQGPIDPGTGQRHAAWLLSLEDLFDAIMYLMQIVFIQYMRVGTGSWKGVAATWENNVRPFEETVIFRKHLYTTSRAPGADLTYGAAGFVALISNEPNPADQTANSAAWIGGMLVSRGQSFHEQENCWNLLRVLSENGIAKTLMRTGFTVSNWTLDLEVLHILDNSHDAPANAVTLTPGMLQKGWTWTTAEADIRACIVKIAGAGTYDQSEVRYGLGTNQNEKAHTLQFALHNQPTLGSGELRYLDNVPELTAPNVAIMSGGFDIRKLYYEDTPGIATGMIAMRMSGNCSVIYAKELTNEHRVTLSGSALATYPNPPLVPGGGGANFGANATYYNMLLLGPLGAMVVEEQRIFNYAYACCQAMTRLFGRNLALSSPYTPSNTIGNPWGTAMLKCTLYGIYEAFQVGRLFYLSDSPTDGFSVAVTGAGLFDRTPSQRILIATSLQPDEVTGTTAAEFVALDDRSFYNPP